MPQGRPIADASGPQEWADVQKNVGNPVVTLGFWLGVTAAAKE